MVHPYRDLVYGAIEIPDDIWRLLGSEVLVRLAGISHGALPQTLHAFATAGDRRQHSIGVWYQATQLCRRDEFRALSPVLPLAALLHDAASPPFSHVSEPFMRAAIGYDGETYLPQVMADSGLAEWVETMGGDPALVAGRDTSWSPILSGPVDLDNWDGILRFARASGISKPAYWPFALVHGFLLGPDERSVELSLDVVDCVRQWKALRRAVYRTIYSDSQLNFQAMLQRALELAFVGKELPGAFWSMTDLDAFEYLRTQCNPGTQAITQAIRAWDYYGCVIAEWSGLEDVLGCNWADWRVPAAIANHVAETAGCPPHEVAVYVGVGKDVRPIAIPFRNPENGEVGVVGDLVHDQVVRRIRIFARNPPSSSVSVFLQNVPQFCRAAIHSRIPRPLGVA